MSQRPRRYVASAQAMLDASGYTGASSSRRSLSAWNPNLGSADAAMQWALPALRERSRDLARNAPVAVGALATVVSSVVGTGLSLQAAVDGEALGLTEARALAWQQQVEREWRMWSESPDCDAARRLNFYGLQALAFRSALECGDCLVILPAVTTRATPYRLAVQLVEADRVCNPGRSANTATRVEGVDLDAWGGHMAYHVASDHPMGRSVAPKALTWQRVPVRGAATGRITALLLADLLRPAQTRGVPYLAAVIEPLKQLDRYTEAEIMAAVVSGLFTVFVKSDGGIGLSPVASAQPEEGSAGETWNGKLGSGLVVDLQEGESVETANPGRPNTAFDPFVQAILRQIGMALEIPFEILIRHYTASYSAARAAMLDAWRFFRRRRDWLATMFCQPIYGTWLAEAIALRRIAAPGFFSDPLLRKAWSGAIWVGDGPGSIDPSKETEDARAAIELGISTKEIESIKRDGIPYRVKLRQRAREVAAEKKAGVAPAATAPSPSKNDDEAPPEKTEEAADGENEKETGE